MSWEVTSLDTRRQLEPKCAPQLFLESLLGTRHSAVGRIPPPPPPPRLSVVTFPEVFAKVNSTQFPSRF